MNRLVNERISSGSEPSKNVEAKSSSTDSQVPPTSSPFTAASASEADSDVKADENKVITLENNHGIDKPLITDETTTVMDGEEEEYEHDDDDDGDGDEYTNNARPIFDLIKTRVTEILKATNKNPPHPCTFSAFKAFWREKYAEMRSELAARNESSIFLTSPPLKALEIEIQNVEKQHECPCCFDYADADIIIREEGGITRDHLLKAISDRLYGKDVEKDWMPLKKRYWNGRLVVRDWNFMLHEGDCFYKGSSYGEMRIWMRCGGAKGGDDGD